MPNSCRPLILLAVLACAGTAQAGAWPREAGTGFASAVSYLSWPIEAGLPASFDTANRYDTLYVEYGLRPRWTVGLDLGRAVSGSDKAVVFARRPFARPAARVQIAAELGLGQIDGASVLRPGFSIGSALAAGWVNADVIAEYFPQAGKTDVKIDLTYGRKTGARTAMIQFQMGREEGDADFLRIVPSLLVPLWRDLSFEMGASYGVTGDTSIGAKFGLWTEF